MSIEVIPCSRELLSVQSLARMLLSPLCGISKSISFLSRGDGEPRFVVAGGDLTGAHWLTGQPEPPPHSYHIGGSGCFVGEALVKALGESLERYAQLAPDSSLTSRNFRYGSASTFSSAIDHEDAQYILPTRWFTNSQYQEKDFPFQKPSPDQPYGWIPARDCKSGVQVMLLAQLALVGYVLRESENRVGPGVTSGTAVQTNMTKARLSALLELYQIDASMGHWYSDWQAINIKLDGRLRALQSVLDRYWDHQTLVPNFYWIPHPDLPGFTVSCLFQQNILGLPSVAIGQACHLNLERAMYKSLLEAAGVYGLAKINMLGERLRPDLGFEDKTALVLNLDDNVTYYAQGYGSSNIVEVYSDSNSLKASEMPPDWDISEEDGVKLLIEKATEAGLRLYEVDLNSLETEAAGLKVARYWSPDLLPLSLPGTPSLGHNRLAVYGGAVRCSMHPYP